MVLGSKSKGNVMYTPPKSQSFTEFLAQFNVIGLAIGFIIASIGSFWSMVGSVFFLLACLVFLIPFFRKD